MKKSQLRKLIQEEIQSMKKPILENEDFGIESILTRFEQAMTDKGVYASITNELENAGEEERDMIEDLIKYDIPERINTMEELIEDLFDERIDPDDVGFKGSKKELIQNLKQVIKISEFAIKTLENYI